MARNSREAVIRDELISVTFLSERTQTTTFRIGADFASTRFGLIPASTVIVTIAVSFMFLPPPP
jgi:hypothetical protein